MTSLARPASPSSSKNDLGALLRRWRGLRSRSQLQLSGDSGISQRHISFIESGRSVPSRAALMALARSLDVPLRERNALLLAAGYAPAYSDARWDDEELRVVKRALVRMLRQQEPYPALVMDRHWNVLTVNAAAPRFFGTFADLDRFPRPRNLLRLVFDPHGLRPTIANWERTARVLLQRVRREAVGRALDDGTLALVESLLAYPDVSDTWWNSQDEETGAGLPVVPIGFMHDGRVLNYFSMVANVGTPQAVAAEELRLECMFPADDETEVLHQRVFCDG
jgi:transcriptional regulator with XRE-family HTH domain